MVVNNSNQTITTAMGSRSCSKRENEVRSISVMGEKVITKWNGLFRWGSSWLVISRGLL